MPMPQTKGSVQIDERDFVKVKYLHPNRGSHGVIGTTAFPNRIEGLQMKNKGDGWYIDYGYRSGGTVFTIHRSDAEAQSHLYYILDDTPRGVVNEPRPMRPATPPPAIVEHRAAPVIREDRIPVDGKVDLQLLPGMTAEIVQQLELDGISTKDQILKLGVEGLKNYRGVGDKKGKMIIEAIKAME